MNPSSVSKRACSVKESGCWIAPSHEHPNCSARWTYTSMKFLLRSGGARRQHEGDRQGQGGVARAMGFSTLVRIHTGSPPSLVNSDERTTLHTHCLA